MSLRVLVGGTTGLILIAALLYGTHVYVSGSGSALAKYTVKKNSTCLSANTSTDQNDSSDYNKCMSELEMLVKTLINNHEINLQDCDTYGNNPTTAYCQVRIWYHPNTVIVTDSDSVTAINERNSYSSVSTVERRKRNANKISSQIVDEDIFSQDLLKKVQNTNIKMQRKLQSSNDQQQIVGELQLNKQKQQQHIQSRSPTEIHPTAEPPVSKSNLGNVMEDKQNLELVGLKLANEVQENITQTEQSLESQLQKPNIYLDLNESVDYELENS